MRTRTTEKKAEIQSRIDRTNLEVIAIVAKWTEDHTRDSSDDKVITKALYINFKERISDIKKMIRPALQQLFEELAAADVSKRLEVNTAYGLTVKDLDDRVANLLDTLHKSKLEDGGGRDGGRDNGRGGGGDHRDHRDHRDHGPRDGGRDRYHHAGGAGGALGNAAALGNIGGLAQLLAKPEALTALTTLAGLGQLGGLGAAGGLLAGAMGGGLGGAAPGGMGGLVTGVHRSRGGYGSSGGSRSSRDDDRGSRDSKRSKFAPY